MSQEKLPNSVFVVYNYWFIHLNVLFWLFYSQKIWMFYSHTINVSVTRNSDKKRGKRDRDPDSRCLIQGHGRPKDTIRRLITEIFCHFPPSFPQTRKNKLLTMTITVGVRSVEGNKVTVVNQGRKLKKDVQVFVRITRTQLEKITTTISVSTLSR